MDGCDFYRSQKWRNKRKAILKRDKYRCVECRKYGRTTQATHVHHIKELEHYPELVLDDDNLVSLCAKCHNKKHPEKGATGFGNPRGYYPPRPL